MGLIVFYKIFLTFNVNDKIFQKILLVPHNTSKDLNICYGREKEKKIITLMRQTYYYLLEVLLF